MTAKRVTFITAVGATLALSACFDTSPIDYEAPTPEAGSGDGGPVPEAGPLIAECTTCLQSTGMKSQWDACAADTECLALETCMVDSYCLTLDLSNLAAHPPMRRPLLHRRKDRGQQDPALFLFLQVNICAQNPMACARASATCGESRPRQSVGRRGLGASLSQPWAREGIDLSRRRACGGSPGEGSHPRRAPPPPQPSPRDLVAAAARAATRRRGDGRGPLQ